VRPGALEKERLLPYKRPALKEAANKCRGMADSQNRLTKLITTTHGRVKAKKKNTSDHDGCLRNQNGVQWVLSL
jgi:hypothetical protein